jgi:DNA-binding transcriptional LysR family regulator
MQLTHIRKSDLNLLPALAVLLEERSISRAAARHHLSQPAMSRVLQRLRGTFGDELLIRTAKGYQLTPRAMRLQGELRALLQETNRLLRGDVFDPAIIEERFRLCCPDYMAHMFAPRLAQKLARLAPRAQLEIIAWHDGAFEDTGRGRLDVLLWANRMPAPLHNERIFVSEMVCVLSAAHPVGKRPLTMEKYLAARHVRVNVLHAQSTMVEDQLIAAGHHREIGMEVPYFGTAIAAVQDTDMIATVPRAAADQYTPGARVRVVAPPFRFAPINILMGWHPSTHGDAALHWFRGLLREAAREIHDAPRGALTPKRAARRLRGSPAA